MDLSHSGASDGSLIGLGSGEPGGPVSGLGSLF